MLPALIDFKMKIYSYTNAIKYGNSSDCSMIWPPVPTYVITGNYYVFCFVLLVICWYIHTIQGYGNNSNFNYIIIEVRFGLKSRTYLMST